MSSTADAIDREITMSNPDDAHGALMRNSREKEKFLNKCSDGNVEFLSKIFHESTQEKKAEMLYWRDEYLRSGLMRATYAREVEATKILLDEAEKLDLKYQILNNQKSSNGWTALHWACYSIPDNPKFVKMLIDLGADRGIQAKNGRTPLQVAVCYGNLLTAEELIVSSGGDFNRTIKIGGKEISLTEYLIHRALELHTGTKDEAKYLEFLKRVMNRLLESVPLTGDESYLGSAQTIKAALTRIGIDPSLLPFSKAAGAASGSASSSSFAGVFGEAKPSDPSSHPSDKSDLPKP